MKGHIDRFLHHLSYERRYSAHTVEAYGTDLEHFREWCLTKMADEHILSSLNHYHLREYLSFCFHRLKNVSIARKLSALRTFLKYLVKIGEIKASPADLIENPKVTKPLPKPVTVEEAFALCDLLPSDSGISVRDLTICELLYATGIRVSELVALDLDHVDMTQKLLRVMGKGKKERIVPFHQICHDLLLNWIENHRGHYLKNLDEKAIFLGERGERIHPRVVRASFKRIGVNLNINQSLHPHRLRHAFASHMLQSGADLRGIQELLGHATIATTERYTEVDLASLMRDYDQAHPHAKKKSP
jgi:integrase/recombinase XerC